MDGWICIHKKILNWEWYDDVNTFRLFIHCLLKANYEDKKWHGTLIKRGSFVTSNLKLAQELKLTRQQIKTAIFKLKSTNEIANKSTSQYSIITVKNYNLYQDNNQQNNQRIINKRPTDNQQ